MINQIKILLKVLIICFLTNTVSAQTIQTNSVVDIKKDSSWVKDIKFELEKTLYLSQAGISNALLTRFRFKRHSIGIGPKIIYTSSIFPYQNTLGLDFNYRFCLLQSKKINSFFNAQHGFASYKVNNRSKNNTNLINEFIISNGFSYNVFNKLWIGNTVGLGLYTDRFSILIKNLKGLFWGIILSLICF